MREDGTVNASITFFTISYVVINVWTILQVITRTDTDTDTQTRARTNHSPTHPQRGFDPCNPRNAPSAVGDLK